jgi:long-chain-fatty-acid--CoA ligase ACSBG
MIMNLASIMAGGKSAGVYTTNGPELCQYVSEHSQAVVVCCQDAAQVAKYVEIRDNLPKLKAIVVWEGEVPEGVNEGNPRARVYSWEEFIETGRSADAEVGARVVKAMNEQKPEDPVTLIYTSGTTGNPKGK